MADLKTKQQKDLLYYATLAGHKEVDYKEYKPSTLSDITAEDKNTKSASAAATISIYYYHPDHLGTNTLLTDMSGNAYQLFINLPFGETNRRWLTQPLKNQNNTHPGLPPWRIEQCPSHT